MTWDKAKPTCVPNEDSGQPTQPHSLIRVYTVCMKDHWSLLTHRELGEDQSDCVDVQDDLNLLWAHNPQIIL